MFVKRFQELKCLLRILMGLKVNQGQKKVFILFRVLNCNEFVHQSIQNFGVNFLVKALLHQEDKVVIIRCELIIEALSEKFYCSPSLL
jgi:hypothetical protein